MTNLTKSKKRIRDHGEVFTPDFIVNDMLNLVNNETQRIDSRFLEPACGDGNFLIKILERKLNVVEKNYKKQQFDYEKYSILAVSSIYGVELLGDNAKRARERLFDYFVIKYKRLFKKLISEEYLKNISYLFGRNIVQGNALTLEETDGNPIIFSEWSLVYGKKFKRRDFKYKDLGKLGLNPDDLFSLNEVADNGETVFIPIPVKEYPLVNFMDIYKSYE
jgi:hypothetical protein